VCILISMLAELEIETPIETAKETIDTLKQPTPSFELPKIRNCNGSYFEPDIKETNHVNFEYDQYSSSAMSQLKKNFDKYSSAEKREILDKHEALGLENIAFNVFSKDKDFKGDYTNKNVYVLLHGWTANKDIFSEVSMSGGISVVEQIMAMDPDAVIICPDGNGFGKSLFREDVKAKKNFGEYCTSEAYAKQMDFLIRDVLKVPLEQVTVAGHSMGGAATYQLMKNEDYKNGVAMAPAAFPSAETIRRFKEKAKNIGYANIESVLKQFNINGSALLYNILGSSVTLGNNIRELGGKLPAPFVEKIVENIFTIITPYLMGKTIEGAKQTDGKIINSLTGIHSVEITPEKYKVVSEAIKQLGKGIDYSNWKPDDYDAFIKVITYWGTEDVLVQPNDLEGNILMAFMGAMGTAKQDIIDHALSQNLEDSQKIVGGHYSTVYNPVVIADIVKLGRSPRH